MKVDTHKKNEALLKLIADPSTVVFLDANIIIPPDRSRLGVKPFAFDKYKECWLNPLFESFSSLAVHESVRAEFVESTIGKLQSVAVFSLMWYVPQYPFSSA